MESTQFAPPRDVSWLAEQLDLNRISQRNAAKATGLDPSLLSRSFSGLRRMRMSEFASILAYVESVMPSLKTPVQKAAWSSRLTLSELSRLTKMPIPRLINIINGKGDPVAPEEELKLRGPLNFFRPFDNLTSGGPETRPALENEARYADAFAPSVLDVLSAPWSQGNGYYRPSTTVIDKRERPPALARVPGAYAFIVGDETLVPRWYPGEVLFVHPGQPALTGRWMIASMEAGSILIGRVAHKDAHHVVFDTPAAGEVQAEIDHVKGFEAIVGAWST